MAAEDHHAPTGAVITPANAGDRKVKRCTQLQVNAAKLHLVTDRKQGQASPEWVHRLANADRHSGCGNTPTLPPELT